LIEAKRHTRRQAIGLFRYQLICPALDSGLSTKARGRVVRAIAGGEHIDPAGNPVTFSRETLDRWIRRYRNGGFEELLPAAPLVTARTDAATLEMAAGLKRENPARTAAQVQRILRAATGWAPSETTLLRLFRRLELTGPAAGVSGEVFGRFEAENPNVRWVGDGLHGPRVGGRKTYLFAWLDDHTRLLTGYRFGFAEDTVRLALPFRKALAGRGVPQAIYVDNGSAYIDAQLMRACAKLGIRLVHSTPHRPQGRGKIERFFRTVRDQFLVEVTDSTAADLAAAGLDHAAALAELNRSFIAWAENEYHRRVHSETGQTPLDRWEQGWTRLGSAPVVAAAADLSEAFRWSEYRTVTKTATVSLHSNTYEINSALVGRKVELVFDPFRMDDIEVRYQGKSYGKALPFTITRHAHPKARPETSAPEPAPKTGIDYLALTGQAHEQRLGVKIGFHALYDDTVAAVLYESDGTDGEIPGRLAIGDGHNNNGDGNDDQARTA